MAGVGSPPPAPAVGDNGRVIVDCAAYIEGERVDVDGRADSLAPWGLMPAEQGSAVPRLVRPSASAEGFCWLGLRMPDEHELTSVCNALHLDEVSPTEILRPHARPVLSMDGPTMQLVLRTARYEDRNETISLGEMTLLVGPRSVVSIRHGQASPLAKVRANLERDPERLRLGPTSVLAAVVGRVIGDYGPALDGFETDVVEAEREVFSESQRQPVRRLYHLKREVRRLLVAIDSLQDPLTRLIRKLGPQMPPEVAADLEESADQLDRAVTRATSLSGLLDAALAASLTQITVRQNDDMRKISAWVAMAAVPTLVAGIYGMNFEHMPELGWTLGYPLALAVMGVIVLTLYRYFKRSGWL